MRWENGIANSNILVEDDHVIASVLYDYPYKYYTVSINGKRFLDQFKDNDCAKSFVMDKIRQNSLYGRNKAEIKIENLRGGKIMEKQVKTILEEFGGDIRNIADELARGDNLLSDELMSEMYIYILTTSEKDKLLNLENAKQTAIDYLSKKGMVK